MRHPSTISAFAHWDALRGERAAPAREGLQPVAMREALADVFIIERSAQGDMVFAIAGSRVSAMLGGEMRGLPFLGRWKDAVVASACLARIAGGGIECGEVRAEGLDGTGYGFEFALMPLSRNGVPGRAALGVMAPLGPNAWSGQPVGGLSLVSREALQAPRGPRLSVLQGGLA